MARLLPFLFLWLSILPSYAQKMQKGYDYLETGKYDEAKDFFENILKEYPDNKTAKLCYGRAVGLSGDSIKAVTIFTELRNEYPNDFEIKLNHAESLLWDKRFVQALSFYEDLVAEKPSNFPAVLGYANTLSNLKKYEQALVEVDRALAIQSGNVNAKISRKYIRLGYAHQLSQNRQYEEALSLLNQNLVDFPNDKDTQLNKATIFLETEDLINATKVYQEISVTAKDSIAGMNGLALVAHKQSKEKKALALATKANTSVALYKEDAEVYLSTKERYIQALLWNRKFTAAKQEITQLKTQYPDNSRAQSLVATYAMYTGDFREGIAQYKTILSKDVQSFDGNLGIANAYRATSDDNLSYQYAFKTLAYYPRQSDAEGLIKTLKQSHSPFVVQKTAFTFDNGNNEAVNISLLTEIPFSTKFTTKLEYTYRNTKNTVANNEASSNELALRFSYIFNGAVSLDTKGGVNTSNAFVRDYTQWTGEVTLKTKPFKRQNLDIGYQRALQNFNADLIDREIVMNNYFLNYNLHTNFNLGWYTQYMYTSQSDRNMRNLVFTSLYYKLLQRPAIKAGINYQFMTFRNQVPTVYFSPEKFNVVEAFVDITSTTKNKWFYGASAAAGYQFIEDDPGSSTYRAEGKLGYRISDRFLANVYGKYSNIASATAAGFEYVEFGFALKWYFLQQPIFDKKIRELRP